MILIFDTETTGKWDFKQPHTYPEQPFLVELGAILCDLEGREYNVVDLIVQPEGWQISDAVAKLHGINQVTAENCGVPMKVALSVFNFLCHQATKIVCHNVEFDSNVMRAQYSKFRVPDRFGTTPTFCTMKALAPVLKLPKKFPKKDDPYKWPTLTECHQHYFGEAFEGAHNALNDVQATKRVLFEAIARGDLTWQQ